MVLNVPPSATNVAVYGELGRMPYVFTQRSFNDKVLASSCFDISSLLWDCYNYHKLNSTLWLSHVQSILNKSGLSYVFDEVNMLDPSHIISELKGRLTDQYLQKWNEELCNVSKMRT